MQQIEIDVSKHDVPQNPYGQDDGVAEALGSGADDILLVTKENRFNPVRLLILNTTELKKVQNKAVSRRNLTRTLERKAIFFIALSKTASGSEQHEAGGKPRFPGHAVSVPQAARI